MTDKDEGFDLELAKVRDEALKTCFGIVPGEPFLANLKLGHEEFPVLGEFTPYAEQVVGWIRPAGDYVSRIHDWVPVADAIFSSANVNLVFRGYMVEAYLPIQASSIECPRPGLPGSRDAVVLALWPRGPIIRFRAIFSDWPGNGGRWFDFAKVGIQGLPMLTDDSRMLKVERKWRYPDGTEHFAGGVWTPWGGAKLAVDGWQLELRGTRGEGGDPAYSYTGTISRDGREPFHISHLEKFLRRVELFLSVYANRRSHFAVVGASRSIRPNAGHYPAWVSYRCRIRTGSTEYQPIMALDVVSAGNEDTWLALFSDFYRHCADPVVEEAVRHYVDAGENLLPNPDTAFVKAWGAMERLYQKFGNGHCEPGRLLSVIKKNRQDLAELGDPYQYVAADNEEEESFLKHFYNTRNDCAHGRSTLVAWTVNRSEQPSYAHMRLLIRFMRLARALIIVHLKQGICTGTGSGNTG